MRKATGISSEYVGLGMRLPQLPAKTWQPREQVPVVSELSLSARSSRSTAPLRDQLRPGPSPRAT